MRHRPVEVATPFLTSQLHRFLSKSVTYGALGFAVRHTFGYPIIVRAKGFRLKNNYILIDYENIQPKSLDILIGHPLKVLVFMGKNQPKVPVDFASSLQALGRDSGYVKIEGNGSNALDFHIAFYIGQLSERDPNASFHIVSKDTGFDPLIRHLKSKKIRVRRENDLSELPLLKTANATSTEDRIAEIVKDLTSRGQHRPRRVKTLVNTINALFKNTLEETELESLIGQLSRMQYVVIENDNVSYKPPISQPGDSRRRSPR